MKVGVILAAATVFLLTAAFRLLALIGFHNDHFLYLAPAQQMLAGEWPSRDFVDPGTPLMYIVSAAARALIGSPLLAEGLVTATAFGLAAALTTYAAFLASGSLLVAVTLAIGQVAMFPRAYHYPKLLVFAVGILALWGFARVPSTLRAALLAGCVIVAFLFRHDLGVLLAAAALLTAALAVDGGNGKWRCVLRVAGMIVLFTLPYLIYLEATSGLANHIAGGIAYSRAEADRTLLGVPRFEIAEPSSDENARVTLFYLFYFLPVLALAVAGRDLLRRTTSPDWPRIAPVAVLAIAMNLALLRDPLQDRLADVAVPACVLAAWLIGRAWRSAGWLRVVSLAAVVVLGAVAARGINVIGSVREQIDRALPTLELDRLSVHVREHLAGLQPPFAPRQFPSRVVGALVPFFPYLERCTRPDQRLFVAGNAPEIYVFANRLFAGGGPPALRARFYASIAHQRRVVLRMRQQDVPLALILTESEAKRFALVMAELETEFVPVGEIPVEEGGSVLVRAHRRVKPVGIDAATGFPCFR